MTQYTSATWEGAPDAYPMLREAARAGVPERGLVAAGCACARLALRHTHDERVPYAVGLAAAWARGRGTTADRERALRYADAANTANEDCLAAVAAHCAVVGAASDAARAAAHGVSFKVAAHFKPRLRDVLRWVVLREASRRMATLTRTKIPWATLAAAYADRP